MSKEFVRMVFCKPGTIWPSEDGGEGCDRMRGFFLNALKYRIDTELCRIFSA